MELHFSIDPSNEYSGLISFRIDWFDLLTVHGTLKGLLQHNSKAPIYIYIYRERERERETERQRDRETERQRQRQRQRQTERDKERETEREISRNWLM